VQPGRRLLVLVSEPDAARNVCALLVGRGFGASAVTVLEQLGGASERIRHAIATSWADVEHDRLAVVAVECVLSPALAPLPRSPGLPDAAFDHDGQLTKREVRAVTLAALVPVAGQLLWDIGAGSGSVGIEWMRTHWACRAIAIESDPIRSARIGRNAASLGVPQLAIVQGAAPAALAGLEAPDAIFVGGGASAEGVLETCVQALRVGGRLVVNAVTVQSETLLAEWHARLGGELLRISVQHAEPIGAFTGWRPSMPVTQWAWHREQP
jgi:precorrin-6B C5,15-methyltransferase / cobalt-precorrin-6B C5,C15-methyltransferase